MTDASGIQAQRKNIGIVREGSGQQRNGGREGSDHLDYVWMRLQLLPPEDRFPVQKCAYQGVTHLLFGCHLPQVRLCYLQDYFSLPPPLILGPRCRTDVFAHCFANLTAGSSGAAKCRLQACALSQCSNTHVPGNLRVTKSTDSNLTALVAKFQTPHLCPAFSTVLQSTHSSSRPTAAVGRSQQLPQSFKHPFCCTLAAPRANQAVIPSAELLLRQQRVPGLILHPRLSGRSCCNWISHTTREEQDILVLHPRCQGSFAGKADWQRAAFHFSQTLAAFSYH